MDDIGFVLERAPSLRDPKSLSLHRCRRYDDARHSCLTWRQMASTTRQSEVRSAFWTVRGFEARGSAVGFHAHAEGQLLLSTSGTMQVHTEQSRWFVPPQLAIWAPAGVQHRVDALADLDVRMLHWNPAVLRAWAPSASLDRAFALRVTPLLRELIVAAFAADMAGVKTELVAKLILHEIAETSDMPIFLPLPTSAVGRRVADLTLADSGSQCDLHDLASRGATSVRTISRLFPAETGLTFKVWRQRARIVLAIDLLFLGISVARTASQLGFASSAAFCCAFRQVTDMTPTAFLENVEPAQIPGCLSRAPLEPDSERPDTK